MKSGLHFWLLILRSRLTSGDRVIGNGTYATPVGCRGCLSGELPRAVRGLAKHAGVGVRAGMFVG